MIRGKDYIGIAVGIILTKNDKILIIKRAKEPYKDWWALPGGNIEFGETAEKAAIREIKEELGIDIKPKFLFFHDGLDKRRNTHYVELWFSDQLNNKITPKLDEILKTKLIKPKELSKTNLAFTHNKVVNKYQKILKKI